MAQQPGMGEHPERVGQDRVEDQAADVVGVPTDVSRLVDVEALAAATLDTFGAVHVLCNNAGVGGFASIANTSIDDWEWMLGIDLWGPIYGVKVFLPLIAKEDEGHINSTASLAGLIAGASSAPYNVAKHGVVALMATLERELRVSRSTVRASVLCPGPVNTDVARHSAVRRAAGAGGSSSPSWEGDKVGDKISAALANGMDPDDVGRLVLDAIRRDVFWVLTHPRLLRHLQQQVDEMATERTLSRLRVV